MSHAIPNATQGTQAAAPVSETWAAVQQALSGKLVAATYEDGSLEAAAKALAAEGKPTGPSVVAVLAAAKLPEGITIYDKIKRVGNTVIVEDKRGKEVGEPTNAFDQVAFPHQQHIENGYIPVGPDPLKVGTDKEGEQTNRCEDCHSNLPLAALIIKDGKVVGVKVDRAELKLPTVDPKHSVDVAYTLVQNALNQQCDKCHKQVKKLVENALKGNADALAKLETWLGKNLDLSKISAPLTAKGKKHCPSCHPGEGVPGTNIVRGREGVR